MFLLDPWVWLFCLIGLAYLHSGIFQLFPIPGWVDAGMYLGYSLNLPNLVERFGFDSVTYHGSRLSYVLPRFLMHQVLDPTAVQHIETGLLYLASVLSVFAIGWHVFGRSATFLAAAFLAFNPSFLASLTFGGTDGAAICYQLVSAAFLLSPDGLSGKRGALSAAGCFAGLAVAAHLFSVVPLAGVGLAHIVLSTPSRGQLVRYGWLIAGAVLSVMLCGAIGMVFGIDFFFLGYSLNISERALQGFGANYRWPLNEWLFGCYRVIVPAALLVYAALLADFLKDERRRLWALALAALSPLLFYLVWDTVIGGVLIQTRSYLALFLPCVLIAVLALSRLSLDQVGLNGRTAALGCLVIALPSLAASAIPGAFDAMRTPQIQVLLFVTFAAGLVALTFAAKIALRREWPKTMSMAWFATLVVLSTCSALDLDSMPVYRNATGLNYHHAYTGSVRLVEWLEESGLGARKPVFWFDRAELNEQLGERGSYRLKFHDIVRRLNYFDSLASLYLWHRSLLSADLPEIDVSVLEMDAPRDVVVVLALHRSTIERAQDRLQALGYRPASLGSLDYEGGDFAWRAQAFAIVQPEHLSKDGSTQGN